MRGGVLPEPSPPPKARPSVSLFCCDTVWERGKPRLRKKTCRYAFNWAKRDNSWASRGSGWRRFVKEGKKEKYKKEKKKRS